MNLSPQARGRLAAQERKYIDSFPEKGLRVESAWKQAENPATRRDGIECLRMEVHRLAGSAGSYGFEELGAVALKLDQLLAQDDSLDNRIGQVSELVRQLLQQLDARQAG